MVELLIPPVLASGALTTSELVGLLVSSSMLPMVAVMVGYTALTP